MLDKVKQEYQALHQPDRLSHFVAKQYTKNMFMKTFD